MNKHIARLLGGALGTWFGLGGSIPLTWFPPDATLMKLVKFADKCGAELHPIFTPRSHHG